MDSRHQFEEWFDMMQDVGEHCGTSLGQWHRDLMEAAWDASRESLVVELPEPFWPQYFEEDNEGLRVLADLFTFEQIAKVLSGYGIRTK